MSRTLYVTTPIYYVNDVPHPGHAYTTIAADALSRARRLQGHRVFFLTGTDEHGQNIERIARERGVGEQEYCDAIAARFRALWERLGIVYDGFIRTTDDLHRRGVLKLWERLRSARTPDGREAVYRGTYAGWYCPRCESFKTEAELKEPGHLCADHERACEWTEEENFFFRMSAYQELLADAIDPERTPRAIPRIRIDPAGRRNEVLAVLRQGLQDFSISRARVRWGIPVPEQPDHVFYVWMDALSNYVTALDYAGDGEAYRTFWAGSDERLHLIGKEIIRFHCLAWPAMLHAAGLPVPNRFFAHGWLTKEGRKLSKTTGNIIDTDALIDRFGADAVRYYLLREGAFGQDWDFSDASFVKRYNSDLANDLGNLVSRSLTMASRYCDGRIPERAGEPGAGADGLEAVIQREGSAGTPELARRVLARYEELDFAGALAEAWAAVSQLNQRIVAEQPWELAKDPARAGELHAFLYRLVEAVRLVVVLAAPVLPEAARRLGEMLGTGEPRPGPDELCWGRAVPGTRIGAVEALFPRVDPAEAPAEEKKGAHVSDARPEPPPPPGAPAPPAPPAEAGERIDISEFARVELRAGRVVGAERIAKADRLLKLQVDIGTGIRQVVAGIAAAYAPEALVGKSVVIVANLKPAKLRGVESDGMLLAADLDGRPILCTFGEDVPPGSKVR